MWPKSLGISGTVGGGSDQVHAAPLCDFAVRTNVITSHLLVFPVAE